MRTGKLKKLLNLWQENNLISEEQNNNISEFMKERQKVTFFRLLKWLFILGGFWLCFGIIATIINLLELDIFKPIFDFIVSCSKSVGAFLMNYIFTPIYNLIHRLLKDGTAHFFWGILGLLFFFVFNYFATKKPSENKVDDLNLFDEQKYSLKNNFVMDIFACLSLSFCFVNWNAAFMGNDFEKSFPLIYILGAIAFIIMAYKFAKDIYLLFGILFIAGSVGFCALYWHATYAISVSQPVIQILVGLLILSIGYITDLKLQLEDKEDFIKEKFMSTYNWTGLLFIFVALWVATFWGFGAGYNPKDSEIWLANILLILVSVGAMYVGTRYDKKIFFNYGLVFLIIETYTVFCSYIWENLPAGIGALLFGGLLIGTGKMLKKVYFEKSGAK